MQELLRIELATGVACVAHTTRADGDFSPSTVDPIELEARRSQAVPGEWAAVRQIHSDRVIDIASRPSSRIDTRPVGDAMVTTRPATVLAVHSGDCVPVGFVADHGRIGVAHAGWRGLRAGVLESTVRALRSGRAAPSVVQAAIGPHVRAVHYAFGAADLTTMVDRFGVDVMATTAAGEPALDLTAAVVAELARLGVTVSAMSPDCTAADSQRYWSHRARAEPGRIALMSWIEAS